MVEQWQSQNLNSSLTLTEALHPKPMLLSSFACVVREILLLHVYFLPGLWSTLTDWLRGWGWRRLTSWAGSWGLLGMTCLLPCPLFRPRPPAQYSLGCFSASVWCSRLPPPLHLLLRRSLSQEALQLRCQVLPLPSSSLSFPGSQANSVPSSLLPRLCSLETGSFFPASKEPFPSSWYHFLKLMFRSWLL